MRITVSRPLGFCGIALAAGTACALLGIEPVASIVVPEAKAVVGMPATPMSYAGVARRTARRTVAVEGAAVATTAAVAATAAVATTATVAHANAVAYGTAVAALPGGCTSIAAGGVSYFNCSGVYYKPSYQGANLVYVVVQAPH